MQQKFIEGRTRKPSQSMGETTSRPPCAKRRVLDLRRSPSEIGRFRSFKITSPHWILKSEQIKKMRRTLSAVWFWGQAPKIQLANDHSTAVGRGMELLMAQELPHDAANPSKRHPDPDHGLGLHRLSSQTGRHAATSRACDFLLSTSSSNSALASSSPKSWSDARMIGWMS